MEKLKKRTDTPEGYFTYEKNGKKYSVVNFGVAMKSHPYPAGLYMGWEALEVEFMPEPIRADSWEELEKLL